MAKTIACVSMQIDVSFRVPFEMPKDQLKAYLMAHVWPDEFKKAYAKALPEGTIDDISYHFIEIPETEENDE